MPKPLILLSVAALAERDVERMAHLRELTAGGEIAELVPSFPCVTCPVQANMTTGRLPDVHGVVANGFYWRERGEVEMWTSPNECIECPQIWDLLSHAGYRSAVWFPLHAKGCEADYVCTPAPIHNPDGTESLWCYTRPLELYGELRDRLGHFPLQHFWGPMAGIQSSRWIVESALVAAERWRPDFFYIYLPHLDYAAQRSGPQSPEAQQALSELDVLIGELGQRMEAAYGEKPLWVVAGEYVIMPVSRVVYPNRLLREAGLLALKEQDGTEHLDPAGSRAWALADHQVAHVFVADQHPQTVRRVVELFGTQPGVAEVLAGDERRRYALAHPRSGEVVLVAEPDSWFAYYWWLEDSKAPAFARTVDIHRKPGYDPVELCFDPQSRSIPLDASLVKGSHGVPATEPERLAALVLSEPLRLRGTRVPDTDVFRVVLEHFGLQAGP